MKALHETIRDLRIERDLKQKEFGDMLGVSPQTVSAMEKGKVRIYADVLREICQIFEISPNELLSMGAGGMDYREIDPDQILDKYSKLDTYGKEGVRKTIEHEYDRVLNQGDTRAFIYPLIEERVEPRVKLDFYRQAAGMGKGQDVVPEAPDKIEVKASSVPAYTDFVIRATGDSMEPTFSPGDLLFVQKTKHLNPGDIGVFVIDGETLVKEMGEGELISHNSKYEPITKADSCIIQGHVLGKLEQ